MFKKYYNDMVIGAGPAGLTCAYDEEFTNEEWQMRTYSSSTLITRT